MKVRRLKLLLILAISGALLAVTAAGAVTPYDDVLVQKATKDLAQENYDEALAELTEAWNKGSHTPEKAFLLGQTYRQMLNYPKAREYLEEALRLKPNLPPAQLMLADTLLALDKPKEALPVLQALEGKVYEAGQVAFLTGMAEAKEGRYSQARDHFKKAEADPKVSQDAKFQASLALAAMNRLGEARKSMEEAVAINPADPDCGFRPTLHGDSGKTLAGDQSLPGQRHRVL